VELKVILGEHNHCEADNKVSIFSVEKIVTHPQFNISVYAYDIMLLKLNMRIIFNEVVRPICLPQRGKIPTSTNILYIILNISQDMS
jgi:hypothetical protein